MSTRAMVDPRLFHKGPQNRGYGDLGEGIGQGFAALGAGFGNMFRNRQRRAEEGYMKEEEFRKWKETQQAGAEAEYQEDLEQNFRGYESQSGLAPKPYDFGGFQQEQAPQPPTLDEYDTGFKRKEIPAWPTSFGGMSLDPTSIAQRGAARQTQQVADTRARSHKGILSGMLETPMAASKADIFSGRQVKARPLMEQVNLYKTLLATGANPREAHAIAMGGDVQKGYLEGERIDAAVQRAYTTGEFGVRRAEVGANARQYGADRRLEGTVYSADAANARNTETVQARSADLMNRMSTALQIARERNAAAIQAVTLRAGADRVTQQSIAAARIEAMEHLARMNLTARKIQSLIGVGENADDNYLNESERIASFAEAELLWGQAESEPFDLEEAVERYRRQFSGSTASAPGAKGRPSTPRVGQKPE